MTPTDRARQPKGIPVGGQFAASARDEAAVSLIPVADETVEDRGEDDLTPVDVTYEFPAWKLDKAIASIEKANRRAEKAGIDERFGYTVEKFEKRSTDPNTGLDIIEQRARLTLDRPKVQYDGWEFAATLTWDEEAGMVSRAAPGVELIERPKERVCDVCGTARDRRDTYVVQRDGVQMQVGSNCLARFMGIRPAGLWMLDFDPDVSEGVTEPPASARVQERRDPVQVLSLGLAVAERYGWVSRAASGGLRQPSTADRVFEVMANRPRTEEQKAEFAELLARSNELDSEAEEVLEFARNIEGNSDYVQNMRAIAGAETVGSRNTAMLLSAIGSSRRAKEQAAERAAAAKAKAQVAKTSQWVGKEKEKISDVDVTVVSARAVAGDYGTTTIVTMRDTDGNQFKWWATGDKSNEITPGARMRMKGTIKGHDEYQGVKETSVTRARLEPWEGVPGPEPVPAKNAANSYADIHTTDDLDRKRNRQEAAWRRSGKIDDETFMQQVTADYQERWDELRAARRAARQAEYQAERATPPPPRA